MKAKLYMSGKTDPVAYFDDVKIVKMNDNHSAAPYRVFYQAERLNAGRTMVELHRDQKMTLELEDNRKLDVLFQDQSLDAKGNAVGVLRVLSGPVE